MILTDGAPTIAWAEPYVGGPGDEDPSTWNDQPAKEKPASLTVSAETIATDLRTLADAVEALPEGGVNPNDLANAAEEIRAAANEIDGLASRAEGLRDTDLEDVVEAADSLSSELGSLF